jgi:hypothetical protein
MHKVLEAIQRRDRKAQVREAWKWLKEKERDHYRPGHFVVEALITGFIVGATLIGLVWYSTYLYDEYNGSKSSDGGYTATPIVDHYSD